MIIFIRKNQLAFLLALISIVIPSFGSAQNSIEGTISSSDNQPVIGAIVRLDSTFLVTTSDDKGHFLFSGLKKNEYSLSVSHIAFETKNLTVKNGSNTAVTLDAKSYLSDEVNITATRVDSKNGSAFTNISKDEIRSGNLGQDIPYLINNQPSVVVTSDAGTGIGYSGIRLRGNDATRLNVTLNGIPVNDAESHQVYWVDLPDLASSIDNIQLQRGLGSSSNGAGAFGGSLNIQTTSFSGKPYGQVNSSAGSFNTFKNTVSFGSGMISNHFTIDGRLSAIKSDGYIDRATSDLKSLYLSAGYYQQKQSLRFILISGNEKTYQAWYGVTKEQMDENRTYNPAGEYYDSSGNKHYYENQTDNYRQDYYQLLYSRTLSPKLNANVALYYTKGKGYYEEFNNMDDLSNYSLGPVVIGDSTISNADVILRKWLDNDFYGGTWSFNYENKKLNINLGGGANHYNGLHYNEVISAGVFQTTSYPFEYYRDEASKNDVNVFLRTSYNVNAKLNATLDLQERMVDYTFDGLNADYSSGNQKISLNFFNPKISFSYLPETHHRVYLYAGIGHKEPVRDDYRAATAAHRPEPEEMTDIEGGYEFKQEKINASVNMYYMNYASQLILTGKINDVGEYIRESVKNSHRTGIEVQLSYNFCKEANLRINATFSENKIDKYTEFVDNYDDGTQQSNTYTNSDIAFSPSIISGGELNITLCKYASLQVNEKYVGKQFLDNTSSELRQLDAYFLTGLRANCSIPVKGLRKLELSFQVNNLLDQAYISNGYTYSGYISGARNDYNYYFPQAGRSYLVGVGVGF